ncbi:hypothetical protein DI270_023495 [Microbispora triticiradicis]|uniref:Tyr recombinase domain-containing protein n=1 Tax=Microbispora triticiradicis TaxID=2200763 RepID=A0ABX9LFC5_9ACTN|nr:hypothetical protein [Microbispora triticiradicis]RGA02600.1 hypothetical protein DI270_023495 [Microbispora triticiradicis]
MITGKRSVAVPAHDARGVSVPLPYGIRMTPEAINLVVKNAARVADHPHSNRYSVHGLCTGGATDAADAGATMSGICQHGRWSERSPVVMQYIRHRDKWRSNPKLRVGL